ncbi:MAG: NYN domain-containing protein [Chloroflexi bacterium]|nr:NYN domain-containing protein [Chloroflexota bacterium]
MYTPIENYAFIDGNNLRLTFQELKIDLPLDKLISYLQKRHNVTKAYYFIGHIPALQHHYDELSAFGYTMKHRQPSRQASKWDTCPQCGHYYEAQKRKLKCDCDADIVLQVMDDINDYTKAIIISSDGDFDNLVKRLIASDKLDMVIAPCKKGCSALLVKAARGRIAFLDELLDEIKKF